MGRAHGHAAQGVQVRRAPPGFPPPEPPPDPGFAGWIVVNYDLLGRHADALQALDCRGFVFDEAHYIKNERSRRNYTLSQELDRREGHGRGHDTRTPRRPLEQRAGPGDREARGPGHPGGRLPRHRSCVRAEAC